MADHMLPPNSTQLEIDVADVAARIAEVGIPIRDICNPDTCPVELLPWLAWEESVDIWDSNWPEATKRAVIRASLEVHRKKGTPYALETLLAALGFDASTSEWMDYGGEPGKFKVLISGRMAEASDYDDLLSGIMAGKNVRSHLDAVQVQSRTGGTVHIGGLVGLGSSITIGPNLEIKSEPGTHYMGGAISQSRTTIIGPPRPTATPAPSDQYYAGGFHTARTTTLKDVRLHNG